MTAKTAFAVGIIVGAHLGALIASVAFVSADHHQCVVEKGVFRP